MLSLTLTTDSKLTCSDEEVGVHPANIKDGGLNEFKASISTELAQALQSRLEGAARTR